MYQLVEIRPGNEPDDEAIQTTVEEFNTFSSAWIKCRKLNQEIRLRNERILGDYPEMTAYVVHPDEPQIRKMLEPMVRLVLSQGEKVSV